MQSTGLWRLAPQSLVALSKKRTIPSRHRQDSIGNTSTSLNTYVALGKSRRSLRYPMNPYYKPLPYAMAMIVGALVLSGCASTQRVRNERGNFRNSSDGQIALDQQINLTHLHPDTHPEWRLGMDMAFPHPPGRFEAAQLSNAVGQPEF